MLNGVGFIVLLILNLFCCCKYQKKCIFKTKQRRNNPIFRLRSEREQANEENDYESIEIEMENV